MRLFALLLLVFATSLAKNNDRRELLLFAPSVRDSDLGTQLHLLKLHQAELQERDVILVPMLLDHAGADAAAIAQDNNAAPLNQADQQVRRRILHVEPHRFTAILIGKDGSEKFRSSKPVTVEQLDRIIDAMPMRQDEMRRSHPAKE